jgi:CDP-diacylglycerol--glycerol-3-phosphate 3-phosphatidyltransferase
MSTPTHTIDSARALPRWKMQLPMWLTWSRMAVCPIIVAVMLSMKSDLGHWITALLFIAASITDWLDGYFARLYNAGSKMGQFMDPIADKILVASVLVMLVSQHRVGPVLVLLLLTRDIVIGGIRSVAAAENLVISAKSAGKWKTGLQMVSIPAILIGKSLFGLPIEELGLLLMWLSVALSLVSAYQYVELFRNNRPTTQR